jgi:hypothetical protein
MRDRVAEQRAVDQRGPVQRHQQVVAAVEAVPRGLVLLPDPRQHGQQRVDHRVAHVVDRGLGHALGQQVLARLGRVDEQQIRHRVGDDPVDLLGHRAVEAAQAGLDVPDRDLQLGGHQRRRDRRVDVAGDQDDVGLVLEQQRLEPLHHARGLLRVGA